MKEHTTEDILRLEEISDRHSPAADLPDISKSLFSKNDESQTLGEKFIVSLLGDAPYAFPVDAVNEVIRHLKLTNLPNVPEWILGIANLRGDIVSVIDLQKFWKSKSSPYTPNSKLIVVDCEESGSKVAFKVDKICEIITYAPPSGSDSAAASSAAPPVTAQIKYKSGTVGLLDIEETLCSLKLG